MILVQYDGEQHEGILCESYKLWLMIFIIYCHIEIQFGEFGSNNLRDVVIGLGLSLENPCNLWFPSGFTVGAFEVHA